MGCIWGKMSDKAKEDRDTALPPTSFKFIPARHQNASPKFISDHWLDNPNQTPRHELQAGHDPLNTYRKSESDASDGRRFSSELSGADDPSLQALSSQGKKSRVRRLSQTVFEAENLRLDDPVTISVPVPVPVGMDKDIQPGGLRRKKERRASYILLDRDPRTIIENIAYSCVAGAESGIPKRNQDSVLVHMDESTCIFAVFDGHGQHGHHCSSYIKTCLPSMIKLNLLKDIPAKDAIISSVLESETALLNAPFDCSLSGTTATIVMVQASRLLIAWVGDSPCFIVSEETPIAKLESLQQQTTVKNVCTDLAPPHNFNNPIERERAIKKGGRVMRWNDDTDWIGPLRIFLQHAGTPGLNMSRSIGDAIGHKIGVICDPDVNIIDLNQSHKYLVLSSDGVSEFLSQAEIAKFIYDSPDDLQSACDNIIMASRKLWVKNEGGGDFNHAAIDDCSVVIIKLNVQDDPLMLHPA